MRMAFLGDSDVSISQLSLGTMTFGEQVREIDAYAILDYAYERGINFLDSAEMYPVPAHEHTFGTTEMIIGRWFKANPTKRQKMQVATKI
jgi:aryl-alcohol dehydrogenase-like predicted oxidoreductase